MRLLLARLVAPGLTTTETAPWTYLWPMGLGRTFSITTRVVELSKKLPRGRLSAKVDQRAAHGEITIMTVTLTCSCLIFLAKTPSTITTAMARLPKPLPETSPQTVRTLAVARGAITTTTASWTSMWPMGEQVTLRAIFTATTVTAHSRGS